MGLGRVGPLEPTPIAANTGRGGDSPPPGFRGVPGGDRFTLLQTKLNPPRSAQFARLLKRDRLMDAFRRALEERLVVVSAPAGYGKTTLVLQALDDAGSNRVIAWYSIDERDNDPVRFVAYLVGTLHRSLSTPDRVALTTVPLGDGSLEADLEHILNLVAQSERHIVLVIDDYHRISNPIIHGLMDYLIEFMPIGLRLVIVARFDPPLPLARWRSRGELTEFRIGDLSFTVSEIADYLAFDAGDRVQHRLATRIHERTDGWAFALNSLKSLVKGQVSDGEREILEGFAGNRRDLADFLIEEILRKLPEHFRWFLLKTSILSRLNGPLCDAVTGGADGQSMLHALETEGLPIFALDDRRGSYRYHQLLADLLTEQLRTEIGSDGVAELHRRASSHLETHNQIEDAIQHAIEAGDWDRAVSLMVTIGLDLATFRNTLTMRHWLETFPEDYIAQNPSLAFWMGQSLSSTCQPQRARFYLDKAEQRWRALGEDGQLGLIQVARTWCAILEGNLNESLELSHQAVELSIAASSSTQSSAHLVRAVALSRAGKPDDAARELVLVDETLSLPRVMSVERGRIAMLAGEFDPAVDLLGNGIANDNLTDLVRRGYIWLAEISLAKGDLELARTQLDWAEEVADQLETTTILPLIEIPRARWLWAKQDFIAAHEVLAGAIRDAQRDNVPAAVILCESVRAGFLLEQGQTDEVSSWLARIGSALDGATDYSRFESTLVHARYLTFTGDGVGALAKLEVLQTSSRSEGRKLDLSRALLQSAQTQMALDRRVDALESVREALKLLQSGGVVRPFVEEGVSVGALLTSIATSGEHLEFITSILQQMGDVQREKERGTNHSIEPLSVRELEVMRLVSIGLSNREIADELFISVPTVKRHLSTIFEKLGVGNRTQAVAIARSIHKI